MHRLIVVDDEKLIRESILSFEWESIGVHPAGCFESGEKALEYMKQYPVDIVLTDICMPLMSGIQFIEKIREQFSDISVICLSGYDDYKFLRACMKLGASDYILKPINKQELFETVKCVVSGKSKTTIDRTGNEYDMGENSDVQHHYIQLVLEYMEANYNQRITLEKVAEVVALNPVYLSYLFKKVKGVNFSEYLNDVRIREAKQLLLSSTYRISEISEMVGYKEARYFSELFKKRTGISPNEYRNKKEKKQ